MVINFSEWGDLTIDLDSLSLWISSGDSLEDEHPPTGGCIEIDPNGVYLRLTPENAKRLQAALSPAVIDQRAFPGDFDFHKVDFTKPDKRKV